MEMSAITIIIIYLFFIFLFCPGQNAVQLPVDHLVISSLKSGLSRIRRRRRRRGGEVQEEEEKKIKQNEAQGARTESTYKGVN